jgi:hypothetical protein
MAQLIDQLISSEDFVQGLSFELPILIFDPALTVNGALSVEQVLTLPRNAIVKSPFTLTLKAGPADWATAASVANLRQRDISGSGQKRTSVVVDFGVMRTIGAVGVRNIRTFQIIQVKQWAGTAFIEKPLVTGLSNGGEFPGPTTIDSSTPKLDSALGVEVTFPSEIRTDRLQIDLIGTGTDDVGNALLVQVPDLPADLDIRVNGGQPVWNWPGAVPQPPASASSGTVIKGWTLGSDGLMYQQPDISAALTAMLGNPAADITDQLDLHIVLTARSPGALELDLPDTASRTIRYVANTSPASNSLTFDSEGEQDVALPLPAYATSVERIALTATANLPPERVIPPVGPDPALLDDQTTTPLAEMLLDPTHSACVAIQAAGFAELLALRLPIAIEAGGAEMHVQLLNANRDGDPGDPIPAAITKPAVLDASDAANWVTFSFAKPVPLANTAIYAQAVTRRGQVRWALTGTADAGQVFTGPPTGPWEPLPPLGELAALHGRIRIVAHAKRESPVAPLSFAIQNQTAAAGIDVTPTPKGVSAEISGLAAGLPVVPAANKVSVKVISRVAGSLTLTNIVATVSKADA